MRRQTTHTGSFLAVMFDMGFRGIHPVVDRLLAMAMCEVGVVRGLFMLVRLIVLRRFLMMLSGLFVLFPGFLVMLRCLF